MASNIPILNRAIEGWNAGDLQGYLRLYDDAIRLHGYSPEPFDRSAVEAFYREIFAAMTTPGEASPRLVIHDTVEEGNKIACRFTMSGTQTGPFLGVPASGKAYLLHGITILDFRNGRVVERWSTADMLGLLTQIGAFPAPA